MTQSSDTPGRNRLVGQTSPYLLQHASNPVDWFPWGPEALELARTTGKPILLSIGYSACHWCHVMAHESFEDAATAALMNTLFVNIKVDREERPDLDRIYQLAHQLLTRRGGGWPLTMFLMPDDQRPFFGGTYFPPAPRHGMPSFGEVLRRVAQYYSEHAQELRDQNQALVEALSRIDSGEESPAGPLNEAPIRAARAQLESRFDRENGGWGGAPKFPHPPHVLRLLRDWHLSSAGAEPDLKALFMATLTLRRMAEGGLFDQVGGGFSRYSVDAQWQIPHFEKMLYDNGALLSSYAAAAIATGDDFYARVAAATAEFLLRDMQSVDGAFYASLDADSEGHEGLFYLWTPEQVRELLPQADAQLCCAHWGLDGPANFEERWHLVVARDVAELASTRRYGSTNPAELQMRIDKSAAVLCKARAARVWPGRDEKVLTSWNALAIRGLADAARALGRSDLAEAATRALNYLRRWLWRDGRLLATCKDGQAHLGAYLDDHVLLADAILALQSVRFDAGELAFATQLMDVVQAHFEDSERGGYYFTADDHERLIHRSRTLADDAMPSGNAIAAQVFLRLGYLLGEERYLQAAESTLRAAAGAMSEQPLAHVSMLNALDDALRTPVNVILRGRPDELLHWQATLGRLYAPHVLVLAIDANAMDLPPALADKAPADGGVIAYVCRGHRCTPPLRSMALLLDALRSD